MTMPNFLVIGAAKSGTTALYHYLAQHPAIYMSRKNPNFFLFEGQPLDFRGPRIRSTIENSVTSLEAYRALFDGASKETAVGEVSTLYLYLPRAVERIRRHLPEARLIAILRHPAERAYSNFAHAVRIQLEPLDDFCRALSEEERRIRDNWWPFFHYRRRGYYYAQLERYFDLMDRRQIRIYLYEDFDTAPLGVLQDIFRFLDVDETFVPDTSVKHNVSRTVRVPRNKALHSWLAQPSAMMTVARAMIPSELRRSLQERMMHRNLVKPPLLPEVRNQLIQEYTEDISRLQDLIRRDLSKWLN